MERCLAMANVPEYNLNSPYELNYEPDEDEAAEAIRWIFLIICGGISA